MAMMFVKDVEKVDVNGTRIVLTDGKKMDGHNAETTMSFIMGNNELNDLFRKVQEAD